MEHIRVQGQRYPVIQKNISKFQESDIYWFEIPNGDVSIVASGNNLEGTISRFGETDSLDIEEMQDIITLIRESGERQMFNPDDLDELSELLVKAVSTD